MKWRYQFFNFMTEKWTMDIFAVTERIKNHKRTKWMDCHPHKSWWHIDEMETIQMVPKCCALGYIMATLEIKPSSHIACNYMYIKMKQLTIVCVN